ncbi:MAG: (4Fe-4S)-binding protein [Oscillospiraceae bacterium]
MDETTLLASGYRKYPGSELDIYFNKALCQHSANCVHGDPEVFKVGRVPWVLPLGGHTETIVEVIGRCPAGALKYKLKNSDRVLP